MLFWRTQIEAHFGNNTKMDIHAVCVDFSHAYIKTIKQCQLLHSLVDMSIRHPLWLTVNSYLGDRQQNVHWGSCVSNPCVIPAGVLQGWPSSLLPFVICINSLDSHLPSSVIPVKYADLTITDSVGSLSGVTQKVLDSLVQWGQELSLELNGAKTIDMVNQCQETGQHSFPSNNIWSTHQQNLCL